MKTILVTGGAGFIGSHLIRHLVCKYHDYRVVNYDKLTYAGNLENLKDVENRQNYVFVKGDILDEDKFQQTLEDYNVEAVIHLAAESHVDRSIKSPREFVMTNVVGTLTILQAVLKYWDKNFEGKLFYHVSTDEVYGALSIGDQKFKETNKYSPRSPYSASKASSDHFVRAFHETYGLPVVISNCSNNYGPCQFPEKLLPLVINNIKEHRPIPVYGKGDNVRDWLYVVDHARAIDKIFHDGVIGETYNIGGNNEWKNINLIYKVIEIADKILGNPPGYSKSLVSFVKDRAGHDLRYAIDNGKLHSTLGWQPQMSFEDGLEYTIKWYMNNKEWLHNVTSGEYRNYYSEYYGK